MKLNYKSFLLRFLITIVAFIALSGQLLPQARASQPFWIYLPIISKPDTPIEYTRCDGPITGIIIMVPSDTWICTVELLGENETIHLTSPLFTIEMSTLGRGSFCEFPGQDESCVETPFYENKYLSLSTWSSYGEIKEIFGVIRTEITGLIVSVKYIGMEERELTPAERQELIDLFDSISFEK
jgi:hypothetical protein